MPKPTDFPTEQTFPAGTVARCNRCDTTSPLPKPCEGHLEISALVAGQICAVYRLDTMALLPGCGHMDAHWVFVYALLDKEIENDTALRDLTSKTKGAQA